jgi:anti-sigma B factor antagonist
LNFDVATLGSVVVVTPLDEALDAQSAKDFRREMEESLDATGLLLLDFHRVRFVDSSGLGAILACLRRMEGGGGGLKLCGLRPEVRAAVELVRMDRLVDIHGSRDEAVAAFRNEASALNPGS